MTLYRTAPAIEMELDVAAPKIVTSSIRSSVFRPQYHPNPAAYPETKPIAWKEVNSEIVCLVFNVGSLMDHTLGPENLEIDYLA